MDSEDEEDLCEYERKRLQNIKRNHEHLRSLGFDIKTSSAKKEAKRKVTKRKEKSNEDDMEWIPGCEEIGKKRRSNVNSDNVSDLIAPDESVTFQEINNQLHKRFQTALEAVEKSQNNRKRRRVSSSSSDKAVATSVDITNLPSVFHDVPGEDDFYSFSGPDQSEAVHTRTSSNEMIKLVNSKTERSTKHSKNKSLLQADNSQRRKSIRLAGKQLKHYDEPVISDDDEPVISDDDEPVISDDDEPVISDDDEPVISDDDEPVISDDDEPVNELLQHTKEHQESLVIIKKGTKKSTESSKTIKFHQCQYCSKAFSANSSLQRHLRIHTGEKPYQCQYCSKAFVTNDHLQSHLRTHTGEKPYQCQYCSKAFSTSSCLRSHLRIHTGEKPYQCQYCSKAFIQSSVLQRHVRIHTGEKPYQCQHCSKAFRTNGNLQTHLKTHGKGKPY